ncbi:MAG TPA: MBL fold metallo-hydrolase, partial [Candidatus Marinimicrobia bacterium]|nr:MBL fold metallo-hydrolase [Candidatus Neomarinimicrobiota bacterium]
MLVLDVRNEEDFSQFNVEGPFPFQMKNVPYINFMEEEDESVAKISNEKPVKIVCAKEGSAQYVGEILMRHGFEDVSYLINGIKSWGNLLLPKRINNESDDYALYQFIRPGKASCNYGLLYKREMVIFDPSRNIEFYQSFANENDAKIVRIFETHLQADYISGSKQISNVTGAEILAHAGDFS